MFVSKFKEQCPIVKYRIINSKYNVKASGLYTKYENAKKKCDELNSIHGNNIYKIIEIETILKLNVIVNPEEIFIDKFKCPTNCKNYNETKQSYTCQCLCKKAFVSGFNKAFDMIIKSNNK